MGGERDLAEKGRSGVVKSHTRENSWDRLSRNVRGERGYLRLYQREKKDGGNKRARCNRFWGKNPVENGPLQYNQMAETRRA